MATSVQVAVRLRPYNAREISMNAKLCIGMQGQTTLITHPDNPSDIKRFAFDYSYWSHSNFTTDEEGENHPVQGADPPYASQRIVFNDLGQGVLDNAFNGYNSTLFAYGQTGAGKSYSMVGYGKNRGIVPIVCEEMFNAVDREKSATKEYRVTVSMLEIYNEAIRDLLNPANNPPGGLRLRQKPGIGVYVEGLREVPVTSYIEISKKMDEGTNNRTIGSTKMNATSSRAHTVFCIVFTTIIKSDGAPPQETSSRMNLVDLAGSERAESTGATGDRLKEGCAINASLTALGNVITALADIAMGKKGVFVPYRNSTLTHLLQDALGGNSKTIMICALSPADVNYDETLSTLRYADRAKKIKNKVTKNENPTDKLIRMLKEENEKLKKMLAEKGLDPNAAMPSSDSGSGDSEGDIKYKQQFEENKRLLEEMEKSWQQKLEEAKASAGQSVSNDSNAVSLDSAKESGLPYIVILNEDAQLSERLAYLIQPGTTRLGRRNASVKQDIVISGVGISAEHAVIVYDDASEKVSIQNEKKSLTFVDGEVVKGDVELNTNDRVILGNNNVFRFIHPKKEAPALPADYKPGFFTGESAYMDAIDEYNTKQGLRLQAGGELNKLEEEEAKKRKELEARLKQMEEMMKKERDFARQEMEKQRLEYLKRASNLSDDEKAKLAELEETFKNKERNLEEEFKQKQALSEKILQEQQKRQRQTKQLEAELGALTKDVNEANQMSQELGKPVKFEARLAIKTSTRTSTVLDEMTAMKTIQVQVRVTSTANGSIWLWDREKFESRLFLMREIYQEFLNLGPREIPKARDPFWDPPEPFEIGKAYLYLKALSQLVEIEGEFPIVDSKGDEQGLLKVDIFPELPSTGNDDEDGELNYLEDSSELIGKTVDFRVCVKGANGIPDKYSNDVFCTFTFGDKVTGETKPCPVKSTNPTFSYEQVIKKENIDEDFRQFLLNEAAVFEVRGYSDAQIQERNLELKATEEKMSSSSSLSSSFSSAALSDSSSTLCAQCDEQQAVIRCVECSKILCDSCFGVLHKAKAKQNHTKEALVSSSSTPVSAAASGAMCAQCDENAANFKCVECDKVLCETCFGVLHKAKAKQSHQKVEL